MNEVEAGSRNLRRFSKCNIYFQMMLFESISRLYFSRGMTCIAIGLSLFQLNQDRPSRELLKRDKILRSV